MGAPYSHQNLVIEWRTRVPRSRFDFATHKRLEGGGKGVPHTTYLKRKGKEVEGVGLKPFTTRNLICEVMLEGEKENRTSTHHDIVQSPHSSTHGD